MASFTSRPIHLIREAPGIHHRSNTMSFFSSLTVFYPGRPPRMTLGEARGFCDRLREELLLGNSRLSVETKYGKSIDQDDATASNLEWDSTGMMCRMKPYPWDSAKREGAWPELWPSPGFSSRNLYRAHVCLGNLPREVCAQLTAMLDQKTTHAFILPDSLSLDINPVCPTSLSSEELVCYGYIQLSFSGNGYFGWQPLSQYWEQVRESSALLSVLQICRETFPVPPLAHLDQLKHSLNEMFLNRDEYRQGDWVVSISESG